MTTFDEFVAARGLTLLRLAVMLTGTTREAEALLQATFVTAQRQWRRLSEEGSPEANMRGLLVTELLSRRARRRRCSSTPVEAKPPAAESDDVLDVGEEDSTQVVVWQLLASLSPRQRAVLALRHYSGLSDQHLAEALGGRAKAVPAQADQALAALLADYPETNPHRAAPMTIPQLEDSLRAVFEDHEALADESAPERLARGATHTRRALRRRHVLTGVAAAVVVILGIVATVHLHDPASVSEAGPSPAAQKKLGAVLATFEKSWAKAEPPRITLFGPPFPEFRGDDATTNPYELIAGGVVADPGVLSSVRPADGVIRWDEGASASLPLMTAVEALAAVQEMRDNFLDPCPTCAPRKVTGARLSSGFVATGQGDAKVPMWEFDLAATTTRVALPAISPANFVVPAMPPETMPSLFVIGGVLTDDSRELTVQFAGEDPNCARTYSAASQHSEHAVAVLIESRGQDCPARPEEESFATRYITIRLDQPLGDHIVIDGQTGLPIMIER